MRDKTRLLETIHLSMKILWLIIIVMMYMDNNNHSHKEIMSQTIEVA
jgi:hypothetical protein